MFLEGPRAGAVPPGARLRQRLSAILTELRAGRVGRAAFGTGVGCLRQVEAAIGAELRARRDRVAAVGAEARARRRGRRRWLLLGWRRAACRWLRRSQRVAQGLAH